MTCACSSDNLAAANNSVVIHKPHHRHRIDHRSGPDIFVVTEPNQIATALSSPQRRLNFKGRQLTALLPPVVGRDHACIVDFEVGIAVVEGSYQGTGKQHIFASDDSVSPRTHDVDGF